MRVLANLKPQNVFHYFEDICHIPHGSGNTKQVSDYLVSFAIEHHLKYYQDELNNVIMIKEASKGYENSAPVILQGHMDMVCEKVRECTKDMSREGLDLRVSGDYVYAEGTTLGGDDGIAVAIMLAFLADDSIAHPRLETIFTVDEETGMEGAEGLDVAPLKGKRMINIDSEAEGIFTVSCAGGAFMECIMPFAREDSGGSTLKIAVSGLQGGHSGIEINKGRANSSIVLARVLTDLSLHGDVRLISICGGLKDNAIPTYSEAEIVVSDEDSARRQVMELQEKIREEYRTVDPNLSIDVTSADYRMPMSSASSQAVITMISSLPNGVQEMSPDIPGLVQTSLNLGILSTQQDTVNAIYFVRSSIKSQEKMITDRIMQLMRNLGGEAVNRGSSPAWPYKPDSGLRNIMVSVYAQTFGKQPRVEAIHAGLECGIFSEKIPGLDCISIGPDMLKIHTPQEKLSVSSTERLWNFLVNVLKAM